MQYLCQGKGGGGGERGQGEARKTSMSNNVFTKCRETLPAVAVFNLKHPHYLL